jgi:hypothetical protein
MTSIAIVALFAMMGMAVDMGWAFFMRKSAQAAADAAALAAATAALTNAGALNNWTTCPSHVHCSVSGFSCSGSVTVSGTDNLENGCIYARQNGFYNGNNSGRTQTVTLDADLGNPPASVAPGVTAMYWVRANVSEQIPQTFSSVLGKMMGTSGVQSVAIVGGVTATGALVLMNRSNDRYYINNTLTRGANLDMGGNSTVNVSGSVVMASAAAGGGLTCSGNNCAGLNGNNTRVNSTVAYINQGGGVNQPSSFNPSLTARADGGWSYDPTRSLPQPPVTGLPSNLQTCDVANAPAQFLNSNGLHDVNLGPGAYYYLPTSGGNKNKINPIPIGANVRFAANQTSCFAPYTTGASGSQNNLFGNYVLYGGLDNSGGSMTVEPGRYILAGVDTSVTTSLLNLHNGGTITDLTGSLATPAGQNTDAGELFVLTGPNYLGGALSSQISQLPSSVQSKVNNLTFGSVDVQAGNSTVINLHGLNPSNSTVTADQLNNYGPVLFWQDRKNSGVRYDATGLGHVVDSSGNAVDGCAGGAGSACEKSASELSSDGVSSNLSSTGFNYSGNAAARFFGLLYQPRGAFTSLGGSSQNGTPANLGFLRVFTGTIKFSGGANLTMSVPPVALITKRVALVQ